MSRGEPARRQDQPSGEHAAEHRDVPAPRTSALRTAAFAASIVGRRGIAVSVTLDHAGAVLAAIVSTARIATIAWPR